MNYSPSYLIEKMAENLTTDKLPENMLRELLPMIFQEDYGIIDVHSTGRQARKDNEILYNEWHKNWYKESLKQSLVNNEIIPEFVWRVLWLDYVCSDPVGVLYKINDGQLIEDNGEFFRRDIEEKIIPIYKEYGTPLVNTLLNNEFQTIIYDKCRKKFTSLNFKNTC